MSNSFKPINRILLGPGPANVHPKVLEALSKPTLGHLDPQFIELMEEIKSLLRYTFKTESGHTFVLSGPGSLGMEACLVNMIEPGDKVVVCVGGYFANRTVQIVEKIGGVAIVVNSLGATEVLVDEWQLDAVYSCSQKGLACVAGMSPVSFSERAFAHIKNRKTPIRSWFNDFNLLESYWQGSGKRAYHHTAPANQYYGLHEALRILKEEGIENAWRRHKENSAKLIKRLKDELNLEPIVPAGERIPHLLAITVPEGIDEAKVRVELLTKHNLEIGAGLGELAGKVWRIGLMGYNSNDKLVDYCVSSFKDVLKK